MNVLSLFDGISCGRIALERAGITVDKYFASEIDSNAIRISQKNYPDIVQLGDVTKIDLQSLPEIDLLLAGSPCQGFSYAGKKLNFDDPRSRLFYEFVKVLEVVKPRFFLLENVKMKKEFRDIISDALGVQPVLINSADFSAQNRERCYWANFEIPLNWDKSSTTVGDIIDDSMPIESRTFINLSPDIPCWHTKNYLQYDINKKGHKSQDQRAYYYNGKHGTITHSGSRSKTKALLPDGRIMMLNIVECERLQTLPDGYTDVQGLSLSAKGGAIGNGWTVDVIVHILEALKCVSEVMDGKFDVD